MREYKGYTRVNSIKGTHEFTNRKLERHTGAWKDVALDGRLEIHATAAPL